MEEILIDVICNAYNKEQYEILKNKNTANQNDGNVWKELGDCYYLGEGTLANPTEAVRCYKEAADLGNIEAVSKLALCYFLGYGTNKEMEQSFRLAEQASKHGDVGGKFLLGSFYLTGDGTTQNLDKAFELYKECVDLGKNEGYFGLGRYYEKIDDKQTAIKYYKYSLDACPDAFNDINRLDPDYLSSNSLNSASLLIIGKKCLEDGCEDKGIEYLTKSAEKGCPKADVCLGEYYFEKEDYKKAVEHFEKAVEENSDAMLSLSLCYQMGVGVKSDKAIAAKLLKKAVDNGNVFAKWFYEKTQPTKFSYDDILYEIGWRLEKGVGVERNFQEAEKVYREAYQEGNADAEVRLQEMGAIGRYPKYSRKEIEEFKIFAMAGNRDAMVYLAQAYVQEKKFKEAHALLDKAIALGSIIAIHQKAVFFIDGIGIEKSDKKRAFDLLKLSAEQGYPYSYLELACLYNNGSVVEKDLEKARDLAKKALDLGVKDAESLYKSIDFRIKTEKYLKGLNNPKLNKLIEGSHKIKNTYPDEMITEYAKLMCVSEEEFRQTVNKTIDLMKQNGIY